MFAGGASNPGAAKVKPHRGDPTTAQGHAGLGPAPPWVRRRQMTAKP